ncbi:RAMP superfamily CRISPR-associated protein [Shewanella oncorhynchi]|uniref:RAMP superfamily CRISPR-associated protein n=1 Tax=Shewanella oncorhynchi TaxID=2726434 RepID=UPI003D7A81D9
MNNINLHIEILHYWHAGTGSGGGSHLDAITEKDAYGLPFLAGKHIKGLLRHAVHRAQHWQWFSVALPDGPAADLETLIFGSRSQQEKREKTLPGILCIGDAKLKQSESAFLKDNLKYTPFLYQEIYSTAINAAGTAKEHSLRGLEVTLPVVLQADLSLEVTALDDAHRQQQQQWLDNTSSFDWLEKVLPLIDSIGAHRTRGLGEAVFTLQTQQKESVK